MIGGLPQLESLHECARKAALESNQSPPRMPFQVYDEWYEEYTVDSYDARTQQYQLTNNFRRYVVKVDATTENWIYIGYPSSQVQATKTVVTGTAAAILEQDSTIIPRKGYTELKCECGAEKCGMAFHSEWCPKNGE